MKLNGRSGEALHPAAGPAPTQDILLQVPPEGLVSETVQDGVDKTGEDLGQDEREEAQHREMFREEQHEALQHNGLNIHHHAQQHLEAMQQDGVVRFLGVLAGWPCDEQDAEVGVEEREPHDD